MSLCAACEAFDIQSFRDAPYQTRGYKLVDVEHSAKERNCAFCQFLYSTALSTVPQEDATNVGKGRWIHLRMSENGNRRDKDRAQSHDSHLLRFNRMDVILSDRHALFTTTASGDAAWQQDGVQCRLLADPGMF